MTETTNFNLKKPDLDDFYNVGDFNDNADIIDEELKKSNDNIAQLADDALNIKKLGWTVPSQLAVKNYIGTNGKFHRKVGRSNLDRFSWTRAASNDMWSTIADFDSKEGINIPFCSTYPMTQLYYFKSSNQIRIYTTESTKPTGYIYYELATEEVLELDGQEAGYFAKKNVTTNLLKPTLQSTTSGPITLTNNGDGTYTVNGTASSTTQFNLVNLTLPQGRKYKYLCDADSDLLGTVFNTASGAKYEQGQGVEFIAGSGVMYVSISVLGGHTVSNKVVRPMLTTDLDATYDDFVPYTGDTGSLNGDVAEIKKGWELIGSVTGSGNSVMIDSAKYSEFFVVQTKGGQSVVGHHHLISIELTDIELQDYVGGYRSSTIYSLFSILYSKTKITCGITNIGSDTDSTNAKITVYGKR